jgi:dTDP-4-amino-4,6-dideoxygalactose transaminase
MSEVHTNVIARVSEYLTEFLAEPRAFRGQQLRGGGPVREFETLLADQCGFRHCVATCNATTALLGLGLLTGICGKTVLFPKNHWEGSMAVFRLLGAIIKPYPNGEPEPTVEMESPRLVIVGSDSMSRSRVRNLKSLSRNADCLIVEDSSRLPGFTTNKGNVSHADLQVVSFGPGKPLPLGEGGAALFRNQILRRRFVSFTQHPERFAAEYGAIMSVPKGCAFGRIHPLAAIIGSEILRPGNVASSRIALSA